MVDLGFVKIDSSNFIAIVIGIAFFVLQILLVFKVKLLIIKLLPTILTIIVGVVCFICMSLTEGWDAVGWLLLMVFCLIYLGVCAFALLIYGIVKLITRKKSLD